MSNRFHTVEDALGQEFYQLPKDLIKNNYYKDMSANSKIAYAILKDRHSVSLKNKWFDDLGRVYFLFSDKELAEVLDTSIRTASRYKNELHSYGLIHMERQGLNKRNRIYILKVESETVYKKSAEPLKIADKTILSSPEQTKLSSQDRTEMSSQDRTEMSTLSKKNLSKSNLNKKEEEEEKHVSVVSFFEENITTTNGAIKAALKDWTNKLPIDVVMNEISFAAKHNAKSYAYLEKLLQQDLFLKIDSIEKLEQKRNEHTTKKSPVRNAKTTRKETVPEWFDKQQEERKEKVFLPPSIDVEKAREELQRELGAI